MNHARLDRHNRTVDQESWRGHWWLPGSDTAVAGTLYKLTDGHLRLELGGRLRAPSGDRTFMVLGETMAGPFTLLECHRANVSMGRISQEDISAERYVRGIHLGSADDALSRQRLFRSSTCLAGWVIAVPSSWSSMRTIITGAVGRARK